MNSSQTTVFFIVCALLAVFFSMPCEVGAKASKEDVSGMALWSMHPDKFQKLRNRVEEIGSGEKGRALVQALDFAANVRRKMRTHLELIYFYKPGCSYCKKQRPIVLKLSRNWSFGNIRSINVSRNIFSARKHGVNKVPTILVRSKGADRKTARVGVGHIPYRRIEKAIVSSYFRWFAR